MSHEGGPEPGTGGPLTVTQTAAVLGVKPATIYALCRAGQLGHLRIGVGRGTIRIELADIERFKVEARAKGAPTVPEPPYALKYLKLPPLR